MKVAELESMKVGWMEQKWDTIVEILKVVSWE
jgi:hypothetical protein